MTLKLRHNIENDKNVVVCAKVRSIFGLEIDEITSTFKGGIPSGQSVVKLRGFIVDISFDVDGIPNGPFRVRKNVPRINDVFHFGRFKNGNVIGNCWILSADKVLISSTFYMHILRAKIPKAEKDPANLTELLCFWEGVKVESKYFGEIKPSTKG